jgi:hypothetical protein
MPCQHCRSDTGTLTRAWKSTSGSGEQPMLMMIVGFEGYRLGCQAPVSCT